MYYYVNITLTSVSHIMQCYTCFTSAVKHVCVYMLLHTHSHGCHYKIVAPHCEQKQRLHKFAFAEYST